MSAPGLYPTPGPKPSRDGFTDQERTARLQKKRNAILDRAMEIVSADENTGICLACQEERDGCEPDARAYPCDSCNKPKVYGASEILLMLG